MTEADVTEWLPIDENGDRQDPYFKDFVDRYLTPQELYARIEQLHAQYPELTEIVELPVQDERLPAEVDGVDVRDRRHRQLAEHGLRRERGRRLPRGARVGPPRR